MGIPIDLIRLRCSGKASCAGGTQPHPPLDAYPLLAFVDSKVVTEDGAASVEAIGLAVAEMPDLAALADRFGTSHHHIVQALDYAIAADPLTK